MLIPHNDIKQASVARISHKNDLRSFATMTTTVKTTTTNDYDGSGDDGGIDTYKISQETAIKM